MNSVTFNGKTYKTDNQGFLTDNEQWDEEFAEGMAAELGIEGGLNKKHWRVIHFIRNSFQKTGECPLVYESCRQNGFSLKKMKKLFPSGYLRCACKLAGITYSDRRVNFFGEESGISGNNSHMKNGEPEAQEKTYTVDAMGFLTDYTEWDKNFAAHRILDMKVKGGIIQAHWEILDSMRTTYQRTHTVPTVFDFCEENAITLKQLERLFPAGYHRGIVKAAGLRIKQTS
ncbi:MAG: TusE/DsrC/DsvC family sulfur relay protein [Acidobacteria bacterium]|nr:TusE/DsrC/DsvC family sulfur relay protein [Acidobacteriota bacterium]